MLRIRTLVIGLAAVATAVLPGAIAPGAAGAATTGSCLSAVTVPGTATTTAPLTSVQTGRHDSEGFDRVVLTTTGKPQASVRYVPQVYKDPSGAPLPLNGSAFLQVTLSPSTRASTAATDTKVSYTELREVALAGDFEAVVSYGIGVAAKSDFRVLSLSGPDRTVIDIAFPGRHPWSCAGR